MLALLVTPSVSPDCVSVLRGLVSLPQVNVGLVCHGRLEDVPADIRGRLAGHYRVDNVADVDQICRASHAFAARFGRVDRLLGFAEVLQVQLAQARERLGIPGVTPEIARRFRDKNRMKEVLREAGLPVARQALVRSRDEALRFAGEVGFPIVVKPLAGVGSQGTRRVANVGELDAAFVGHGHGQPVQAEAFIQGPERTFETVVVDGEPVWASQTWYLDRPLDVLEAAWKQWTVLFPREVLDDAGRAFLPVNVAALRALGLTTGIAHMEWFLPPSGGPIISEVGARPPGARFMTMLGYAHEADLWARWAELETLGTWRPLPERRYAVGCAFFRAQGQGERIIAVDGLDQAQREVGALVMDRQLPAVGARPRGSYEGDGWAVVRHTDTEVVRRALKVLVSTVRVWLG
ncbi:MAG TPA: hypothetical protein PKA64_17345 [Myxococcota bacterium]|nr:hypothetical protein [Myxococcota bacterium]